MPKKSQEQIKKELIRSVRVSHRRTKQPVIIAMIGLTGSGASTIAKALSRILHWSVIEKNKIRVRLREKGPGFTPASTDQIHSAMLRRVLKERGNAILDSDFVEKRKRKKLERSVRRFGARVVYLYVTCERDVMLERMLRANYNPKTDIFGGAAIAVREHCRRYPWHYRWSGAQGGRYVPRKPPVRVLAAIDTTDPLKWKKRLKVIARRLRRM